MMTPFNSGVIAAATSVICPSVLTAISDSGASVGSAAACLGLDLLPFDIMTTSSDSL